MPPLASIVVPAHNQLEYCRQCIGSVLSNTRPPYKLILVDNGSTDGVAEFFDAVPNATVVHCGANLGFPAGVNRGLEHVEGHALLLNSDTIVPEGWLEALHNAFDVRGDCGAVGPFSNYVSGEQLVDAPPLNSIDDINAFARQRREWGGGRLRDTRRLVGFCMLIRDRALADVGKLDERFGVGNFEDDDYSLRLTRAGYALCIAESGFVFHYGSRTFAALGYAGADFNALCAANQEVFLNKWDDAGADARARDAEAAELCARAASLDKSQFTEAVRLLAEAVKRSPRRAESYFALAELLNAAGQPSVALEYFRKAAAFSPNRLDFVERLKRAESGV